MLFEVTKVCTAKRRRVAAPARPTAIAESSMPTARRAPAAGAGSSASGATNPGTFATALTVGAPPLVLALAMSHAVRSCSWPTCFSSVFSAVPRTVTHLIMHLSNVSALERASATIYICFIVLRRTPKCNDVCTVDLMMQGSAFLDPA